MRRPAGPGRSRRAPIRSWRGSSCGWAGCSDTWSPARWCSSGGQALRCARTASSPGRRRRRMAREGPTVREGVVAGLIGAAVVAVLVLVFDIAGGAPLQSPAILGSLIFKGVRDPTVVTVTAGSVVGYTIVHGLGFVVGGLIAAALVAAAERERAMVLALLIFFAAFEVFFLALVAFWALPVLGVLAWGEILAGTLVASAARLYYFHRGHPELARSLIGGWVDVVREGIVAGLFGGAVVAVWFYVYDT